MASNPFVPGDVISLSDSDASQDSSPPKKRTLGDEQEPEDSISAASSLRGSKRARVDPPAGARADILSSDEGEVDESERRHGADDEAGDPYKSSMTGHATYPLSPIPDHRKLNPPASGSDTKTSTAAAEHASSIFPRGAYMQPKPSVFRRDSRNYRLPVFSNTIKGDWSLRFRTWVSVFVANNPENASTITPSVAQAAFKHYIDRSGIKKTRRGPAKQASDLVKESGGLARFISELGSSAVGEQPHGNGPEPQGTAAPNSKKRTPGNGEESQLLLWDVGVTHGASVPDLKSAAGEPPQANGSSSAPASTPAQEPRDSNMEHDTSNALEMANAPVSAAELDQQRRYFPSASDPSRMCLLCGREGHTRASCSHRACRFCGVDGHWDFSCPSRVRCTKCRQPGHRSPGCTEKLAMTRDEGMVCAFCTSPHHLENDCTEVWRSFHPEPDAVHAVAFLPASCATCGSNRHFLCDCEGLPRFDPNPTWSASNRSRYLDPECQILSIEDAAERENAKNAKSARAPDLKIRGHAARTTNVVHFSESEESEAEFLGSKKNNRRPPLGQIRMSSNIQMPKNGGSSSGRGQGPPPVQPPLPPGPPPPGPPSHQAYDYPPPPGLPGYGSQPPVPPPSLPPKPPPRDYRHVPPPQLPSPRDRAWQSGGGFDGSQGRNQSRGRGGQGGRGARGGGRGRGRGRGRGF